MLGNRSSRYRHSFWALLFFLVLYFVYVLTTSFAYVAGTALLLIVSWILITNVTEIYQGRTLKRFLSHYANDEDLYDADAAIKDFVFFNGRMYTAVVKVTGAGVYIYSVGICSCMIPWQQVRSIKILRGEYRLRARLGFSEKIENTQNLSIPWDEKLGDMVPESVLFISN